MVPTALVAITERAAEQLIPIIGHRMKFLKVLDSGQFTILRLKTLAQNSYYYSLRTFIIYTVICVYKLILHSVHVAKRQHFPCDSINS